MSIIARKFAKIKADKDNLFIEEAISSYRGDCRF